MKWILATVAAVACSTGPLRAQDAGRPQFDVASIKPSASGPESRPLLDGSTFRQNGQIRITSMSLWTIVQLVDVGGPELLMEGGPGWIKSDRFDIVAKGDPGADAQVPMGRIPPRLHAMIDALLQDRCELRTHIEHRTVDVLALVPVDRASPARQLRPASAGCLKPPAQRQADECTPRPGVVSLPAISMDALAISLRFIMNFGDGGRPIENRTGIDGMFDVALDLGSDRIPFGPEGTAMIITALREQLGLALEPARSERDVFVIDHAERPTPD